MPSIEIADWQREPYRQPAAMMIYSAVMEDFFKRASLKVGDAQCRAEGCEERALRLGAFCRAHHIRSLQENRLLPKDPVGRLFPPYCEAPTSK